MFFVERVARWQYDTVLRRTREDVSANFRATIEPVRIIERSATYAKNLGKPLEAKADSRCAFRAKMERYALAARVGTVVVGPRLRAVQSHVLSFEYRFDQIG